MKNRERYWHATPDEISTGYRQSNDSWECLVCGETFEEGVVYQFEGSLYEAKRAVKEHVRLKHGSIFQHLVMFEKKYTGLTPHQIEVLDMMRQGLADKEIVERTTATSTATIRNLRFQLKEREKQAKTFLAIMEAFRKEQKMNDAGLQMQPVEIHSGATMVDDRYQATVADQKDTIKKYFRADGKLISFPSKEKKKILVLRELAKLFHTGQLYHEKEVNAVLVEVFDDFALLRRYLIEYGFMERTKDGSAYRLKD